MIEDTEYLSVCLMLTPAQYASLKRMAKAANTTNSAVVQAIMRDVLEDEMQDHAAEKAA